MFVHFYEIAGANESGLLGSISIDVFATESPFSALERYVSNGGILPVEHESGLDNGRIVGVKGALRRNVPIEAVRSHVDLELFACLVRHGEEMIRFDWHRDHGDFSLLDAERSVELGVADADLGNWGVVVNDGFGGDSIPVDLVAFLLEQGVDIGINLPRDSLIVWGFATMWRKVRKSRSDRRARAFAAEWESEQGISRPYQLRGFLDSKEVWTVSELEKRLRLSAASVTELLKALGYEPDAGQNWRLGTKLRHARRRAKWLRSERRAEEG